MLMCVGLQAERIDCIAFPDDGAAKRFSKFFQSRMKGVDVVSCHN